ncbi:MAG: hypothetical protein CK424_01600 [Legionella sp.]|nr:MAG: hypothetical protein CK424_01600 [Legionella sp.]
MKSRLLYIVLILFFAATALIWFVWPTKEPQSKAQNMTLKAIDFAELPHWNSSSLIHSLKTFQISCRCFLKQNPERPVGNQWFALQAKDWFPACKAALSIDPKNAQQAQHFFENWFQPAEFYQNNTLTGLFTGYYVPEIEASLHKTTEYNVPIYGTPTNLVKIDLNTFDPTLPTRQLWGRLEHNRMVPFYSREEIDQGAIQHVAPIIAYIRSPIDRLFIEVQGSALLSLQDGTKLNLGYSGKNGLPYTAIGRVLMDRGILNYDTLSKQNIEAYLNAHPEETNDILHKNRSFVFFKPLAENGAFGSQGVPLTPGYSLAVDLNWVPIGMPIWLNTTFPDPQQTTHHSLNRLMIAQDTGGAIKGTVRGDVFWGNGEDAAAIAGKMKNTGRYWLLIPKAAFKQIALAKSY